MNLFSPSYFTIIIIKELNLITITITIPNLYLIIESISIFLINPSIISIFQNLQLRSIIEIIYYFTNKSLDISSLSSKKAINLNIISLIAPTLKLKISIF